MTAGADTAGRQQRNDSDWTEIALKLDWKEAEAAAASPQGDLQEGEGGIPVARTHGFPYLLECVPDARRQGVGVKPRKHLFRIREVRAFKGLFQGGDRTAEHSRVYVGPVRLVPALPAGSCSAGSRAAGLPAAQGAEPGRIGAVGSQQGGREFPYLGDRCRRRTGPVSSRGPGGF